MLTNEKNSGRASYGETSYSPGRTNFSHCCQPGGGGTYAGVACLRRAHMVGRLFLACCCGCYCCCCWTNEHTVDGRVLTVATRSRGRGAVSFVSRRAWKDDRPHMHQPGGGDGGSCMFACFTRGGQASCGKMVVKTHDRRLPHVRTIRRKFPPPTPEV